jgi:hypothetical protein
VAACVLPLASPSTYARKKRTYGTPAREAKVASGFILLLLIGILIGFVVSRVRKRFGLGMTWGTWVTTVVVVGFILLLMWATAYKH